TQAMRNGVNMIKGNQGAGNDGEAGWHYAGWDHEGDMSTVQFAMMGLSAASALDGFDDATAGFARAIGYIMATRNPDGGHRYSAPVRGDVYDRSQGSMSASGLWTLRLAGVGASDARCQPVLSWLKDNYSYTDNPGGIADFYPYYLWAAAKALILSNKP